MNNMEVIRNAAEDALANGKFKDAVTSAGVLVEAGEPWLIDGLLRRALALELWTEGPSDRLITAAEDWRKLTEIAPSSLAYRGYARVMLTIGNRELAYANLKEAERNEVTPEVLLGFAQYYLTASPPDLERAKAYFLRAAMRGRTQGIRGYVETAYMLEQPYLAAGMALLGLAATPLLALVLRERRHSCF